LERMLQLVRAAKAAKGQIGDGVRGSMDRVIDDLQDALAVADSRLGRVAVDLVGQAEAVRGRRRAGDPRPARGGRAEPGSTPVPVTRGSGRPVEGSGEGLKAGKRQGKGVRRG
jgi:hypothetical protein